MKVWRDKEGKSVSGKEFLQRWKEGMKQAVVQMTPLQLARGQFRSSCLVMIGLLCGIVVSIFKVQSLWWLLITLVGSLLLTLFQAIGIYQRINALNTIEKIMQDSNSNNSIEKEVTQVKDETNEQTRIH